MGRGHGGRQAQECSLPQDQAEYVAYISPVPGCGRRSAGLRDRAGVHGVNAYLEAEPRSSVSAKDLPETSFLPAAAVSYAG